MSKLSHLIGITLVAAGLTQPATAQTAPFLEVNPETQTAVTGTTVRLTASTAPPTLGLNIDFEIESGPHDDDDGFHLDADGNWDMTCTTDVTGTCSVPYDGTEAGTDQIRAWIDSIPGNATVEADRGEGPVEATQPGDTPEPDNTDVVTVTWETPGQAPPKLDTEPELPIALPTEAVELTSTVTRGGTPVDNANVDFLLETGSGAGDTYECQTNPSGTCSVMVEAPGGPTTSRVRSWIDANGNNLPDEADLTETQPQIDDDQTDVVEIRWANETVVLDLKPEQHISPPGAPHTIDVVVETNFGVPQNGKFVSVLVRTGPNMNAVRSCQTGIEGTCQVTFPGATEGIDEYLGWIDDNENGLAETGEADFGEGRDEDAQPGTSSEPDDTDVVENEWVDLILDVEPETATQTTGQEHVMTISVTNTAGDPQGGQDVDLEVESGPNANIDGDPETADRTCTTDAGGTCEIRYTGTTQEGTDLIRAWLDRDGDDAVPGEADGTEGRAEGSDPGRDPEPDITDVVEVTWEAPPPPATCVGTDQDDLLIGTDGDDVCLGRGGNDTIRTLGGDDVARGGPGDDVIFLGAGDDLGVGGPGNDTIKGGPGNDTMRGGPGDDTIRGGPGDDTIRGGPGKDTALGGPGTDRCRAETKRSCET